MSETTVVEFTDAAVSKLVELMKEQNMEGAYLRIAAEKDADGRMSYRFGMDTEADADDEIVDGKVRAVVDPNSAELIRGASIDYVDSLERSGFAVSNPNVAGCACGGGGCCGGK